MVSTTGSPWDDDARRPRRVRIRRPGNGGAGAWRGPDSPRPPQPRAAASAAAEPGYAGGYPYAPEPPYPAGPPDPYAPDPYAPDPGYAFGPDAAPPYPLPGAYPYEPDSASYPVPPPRAYPYEPEPAPYLPGPGYPSAYPPAYPTGPDATYPYAPGPYAPPYAPDPYVPAPRGGPPAPPAPHASYALEAAPSSVPGRRDPAGDVSGYRDTAGPDEEGAYPPSGYAPDGPYVPGRAADAGAAYVPGGPGYEFGYQAVVKPVQPPGDAPGYEFGYARDAVPPSQDDLLAPLPGGPPGRPADSAGYGTRAGYTYAPPMTPLAGPSGSGPPGFEFPGTGRPRTGAAGQPPRRPLLALPAGAGDRAGLSEGDEPGGRDEPAWSRPGWRRAPVTPRPAGEDTAGHGPPPLSVAGIKRWAIRAALPMVSMVAAGVAVVATFGGGSGGAGPAPATLSVGFPPATAASGLFSTTPGAQARGINQSLARVASSGAQVVAVGSQAGARISRAQFFVSSDGGQTWRLGTEQAAGGGNPAPGHAATLVAGGQGRWAALGPGAVWTSHDGVAWTLTSPQGIAPMQRGDQVNVLRRTATGFLAAGANVPPGNPAAASPVIWTSADGITWHRLGAAQLHLTTAGGPAGALTSAAASGAAIVISGTVTTNGAGAARQVAGAWRSTNGGTTWSAVTVPVSNGATPASVAVAATAHGFVAVRPGPAGAVVFTSADGTAWKFAATVTGQGGAALAVTSVDGGPSGAVIAGRSGASVLAFTSADGTAWRPEGSLASATAGTVSGVAVTTGGAVVAAGASAAGPLGQQPTLTVDNAGRLTPVSFALIPGALEPEVAVNSIAADGSNQVAVGSANGFPATWFSTNAGTTWSRGAGTPASALNRPGLQELSGAGHGAAGWVAAGGVQSAAAQHPVVVTSADGQTWQAADNEPAFSGAGVFTVAAAPNFARLFKRQQEDEGALCAEIGCRDAQCLL